jgi:lysyl-tRNA synthetase class 2
VSDYEREARRERLEALRAAGVDPFPARVPPRRRIADVRRDFDARSGEELAADPPKVAIAGRIAARRSFGKLAFLRLVEDGASIQVSVRREELAPELFAFVQQLDVGDFVHVEGPVWRTRTNELSVDARGVVLLAKTLRPLPEKWHGLADVESRYRQRYLDLLANEDARRIAFVRSRTVTAMRSFLDGRGFLEVETPVLQPLYGGAAARPFTTHHHLYDQDLYLRISDELYLKRLVIGGVDRVYEIGRNFRNEGISRKHNPEFTTMECYQAYADYRDMMELVQALVQSIADEVLGTQRVSYQGAAIELSGEWPRLGMRDAIRAACGIDILAAGDLEALRAAVAARSVPGVDPGAAPSWGRLVDELFGETVERDLVQPTFVTDYPTELSPLAKRSAEDPRLVERFELFVAGFELANAFSELNDPIDQRERFEEARRLRAAGDEEAHPMDEDFLLALEHGMPPTGGLGVGVDRLAMILADAPSLREVLLFPHVRPRSGSGAAGEGG